MKIAKTFMTYGAKQFLRKFFELDAKNACVRESYRQRLQQ